MLDVQLERRGSVRTRSVIVFASCWGNLSMTVGIAVPFIDEIPKAEEYGSRTREILWMRPFDAVEGVVER